MDNLGNEESPTVLRRLSPGYVKNRQIFIGHNLRKAAGAEPGDLIKLRAIAPDDRLIEVCTSLNQNATVGGSDVAELLSALEISPGDHFTVRLVKSGTMDGDQVDPLTTFEGPEFEVAKYVRHRAADSIRQVFKSVIEEEEGDPQTATRRIHFFSIIDGPAGRKGGVTTASALLVNALNFTEQDTVVRAWNVFLEHQDDYDPDLNKNELYAFSQQFHNELQRARESEDTEVWFIGHTRFSGGAARWLQEEYNSTPGRIVAGAEDGSPKMNPARRVHFVHMAPSQTAAARATAGEGQRGMVKLDSEMKLMRDADLCVFVGNAGSDFLPDPSNTLREDNVIQDFLLPSDDPVFLPEPARSPAIRVLISGRLDDGDVKGLRVAQEAIRNLQLQSDGRNFYQLVICGANPATEAAIFAELESDARSSVSVLPFQPRDRMAHLVATSAVVVLPSAADALGLAAMEGLALARPTLVSNLSGISTFYRRHGMGRWVLPANSPGEWAERIREITASEEDYRRESSAAHTLAQELNTAGRAASRKLFEQIRKG